jgi:hypothetical protein
MSGIGVCAGVKDSLTTQRLLGHAATAKQSLTVQVDMGLVATTKKFPAVQHAAEAKKQWRPCHG